ncbi:two-component system sensor histidine kinase YesM [Paenibacillus anaericanus]|uniref:cache domain-containing sensor histidine kinase n=1 Tax=Paenibacillus anaericanus TaxID=170367 RepID=UPI002785DE5A|nr:sensor histidine kinase [Paenibacillus anaericanus]MDQ0089418.1 two-component system sensor histidine kinase YesM [Paenibacillus anaericanus]
MLISKIYRKYLKNKLFMKIIILFSVITIVTVIIFSYLMFITMSQAMVERQLDVQKSAIQSVSKYINNKYDSVQTMMRDVYRNGDLASNTSYFLEHPYEEYVNYRLDRFYSDNGATSDPVQFFRNHVEDDPDIASLMLYSAAQQYLYVYNNTQFKIVGTNAAHSYVPDAMYLEAGSNVSIPNIWVRQSIQLPDSPMFSVRVPINNNTSLRNIGQLQVYFNSEKIWGSLENYKDEFKGTILVLSSVGEVIFDSSGTYYGQKYPYADQINTVYENDVTTTGMSITKLTDIQGGYTVLSLVPKKELAASYRGLRNTILTVSTICILFAIIISSLFIGNFAKRTHSIIRFTRKVKKGDLTARITDIKEDEIGQIAKSFNEMLEELNLYIDRVYKAEIKQKHTEIAALEARVNPHFLYNTLEVIRMRAISQGASDVGEMIYSLSVLFKSYVQQKPRYTLKDELEACRMYLELFRIRYKDKFSYDVQYDKKLENKLVLKMSLQPIIENYILHGMRTDRADNQISIRVTSQDEILCVEVRDNGQGIHPEKLAQIKQGLLHPDIYSGSFGIRSIHERLKLLYGSIYGVDVQSEFGKGTVVTVWFPDLGEDEVKNV